MEDDMSNLTASLVGAGLTCALLVAASGADAATIHHTGPLPAHHAVALARQIAPPFSDEATLPEQCRPGSYWDMHKYSTDTPEMNTIPMQCHGFGS
jgi:hypothetical protein